MARVFLLNAKRYVIIRLLNGIEKSIYEKREKNSGGVSTILSSQGFFGKCVAFCNYQVTCWHRNKEL